MIARLACLLAIALSLQGCGQGPDPMRRVDPPVPMPLYAEAAARHNARVAELTELWAAAVIRVWYRDAKGEQASDQVDGHLQVRRPDRCAVTFEKVGETYLMLGSDPDRYWWFDLSGDERTASVGTHARVTPERLRDFGLPVHPLDLIDLLGITPLPDEGELAWDPTRGLLLAKSKGRFGLRCLWLDPRTLEPARVELFDADGALALACDLSKYAVEQVRSAAGVRVPGEVLVTIAHKGTSARIRLYETRNHGTRDAAFDLERLRRAYSISRVIDLDGP